MKVWKVSTLTTCLPRQLPSQCNSQRSCSQLVWFTYCCAPCCTPYRKEELTRVFCCGILSTHVYMLCIQLPPQKNWEAVIFKLLHLIQNALGRGSHHEFQCHWVQTIELCNLMVTEYKHIICFLALCLQWMNVSSAELPHLHWSNFTSRMCVLQAFIIDLIGCGLWESELLVISKQYFFRVEPISWNLGLYANHWTWQVPVSIGFSACNR